MNARFTRRTLAGVAALLVMGTARADMLPHTVGDFSIFAGGRFSTASGVQISGQVGAMGDIWLDRNTVLYGDMMTAKNFGAGDDVSIFGDIFANGSLNFGQRGQTGDLMAGGSMYLGNYGRFGSVSGGSSVSLGQGNVIDGDLGANGWASIGNSVHITGDLHAGGGYWMPSSSYADGSVDTVGPSIDTWAPMALPQPAFSSGGSQAYFPGGSVDTLAPGSYAGLSIQPSSTVTLTAGNYSFSSGYFGNDVKLVMDNTSGAINVEFVGQMSSGSGFDVELADDHGGAVSFRSGGTMYFGQNSVLAGAFEAYDNATLGSNVQLTGSLYSSGDVYFSQGVQFTAVIPEPTSFLLVLIGGAVILVGRFVRRSWAM